MCTDDTVYSVTIVTNPSKGPFNFQQTVQFWLNPHHLNLLLISGILLGGFVVDLTIVKTSVDITTMIA